LKHLHDLYLSKVTIEFISCKNLKSYERIKSFIDRLTHIAASALLDRCHEIKNVKFSF